MAVVGEVLCSVVWGVGVGEEREGERGKGIGVKGKENDRCVLGNH